MTSNAACVPDVIYTMELVALSTSITSLVGTWCFFLIWCFLSPLSLDGFARLAHVFAEAHALMATGVNSVGSMWGLVRPLEIREAGGGLERLGFYAVFPAVGTSPDGSVSR